MTTPSLPYLDRDDHSPRLPSQLTVDLDGDLGGHGHEALLLEQCAAHNTLPGEREVVQMYVIKVFVIFISLFHGVYVCY